jgi:pimeloyl-ACP methyl ester carboxylesterase
MLDVIEKGQVTKKHPYPLVFVHGSCHAGWCWDAHFLDFFADRGFHVLAPSLRGHGLSPSDKPLWRCSVSDFVDDVSSIAKTLKAHPILVGHSMGGFVVQKYLEDNDAPAGVLLASAPPRGNQRGMLRMVFRHSWDHVKFALAGDAAEPDRRPGAGARALFGPDAPETLVFEVSTRLQPASVRAVCLDVGMMGRVKTRRVTAPLMVVGAEHDVAYPERVVRATASAYRTEATIIPRVGHDMMLEPAWPIIANRILSWLAERGL